VPKVLTGEDWHEQSSVSCPRRFVLRRLRARSIEHRLRSNDFLAAGFGPRRVAAAADDALAKQTASVTHAGGSKARSHLLTRKDAGTQPFSDCRPPSPTRFSLFCQRLGAPGDQRPSVCIPDVIGMLAVWTQMGWVRTNADSQWNLVYKPEAFHRIRCCGNETIGW